MSREKYAYFTYVSNCGPVEQRTAEVEWLELETKKTVGKMVIPREDFWNKTREELWQDFEKSQKQQDLDAGPDMIAVDPVDQE